MSRPDELPITARLPLPDVEKLERLAQQSDRTRSAEVRRAIREYVEKYSTEKAAA